MSIKTGIMGGTFDPIHYGHLLAAEECRRRLDIDRIVFVPTGSPPHKTDRRVTPAEDRYAMTLLATAGVPEFSVDLLYRGLDFLSPVRHDAPGRTGKRRVMVE